MSKKADVVNGLKACSEQKTEACRKCPYAPDRCSELMKDSLTMIRVMHKRISDLEKGVSV